MHNLEDELRNPLSSMEPTIVDWLVLLAGLAGCGVFVVQLFGRQVITELVPPLMNVISVLASAGIAALGFYVLTRRRARMARRRLPRGAATVAGGTMAVTSVVEAAQQHIGSAPGAGVLALLLLRISQKARPLGPSRDDVDA